MPNYAVQMTLQPVSNVGADRITGNWSCEADSVSDAGDFVTALTTFYRSMQTYLPDTIALGGHQYKVYDRSDPIPRAPVIEGTWVLTSTPTSSTSPPEVCCCLSFQGDKESGVSQARKRGRIYFGPIDTQYISNTGRPETALINALVSAGDALLTESVAATGWTWCVFSASTGDSFPVTNGWVDNEFDTQRRRGRLATARTTFN
jgi:hypothetical protein